METCGLKIVVASSGLGHVSRGIEAWANDLATALYAHGENVLLCKGGGSIGRPFERIIGCLQRESPRTRWLLGRLPRRLSWRIGLGSGYAVEQTTFAFNLIHFLRQEQADILHTQDPLVARLTQRARFLGLIRTRTILAHGTEEPLGFIKKIRYLQHLAPWHLEEARKAGVWKPSWTAIPNFIDTTLFSPGRAESLREELKIPPHATVVLTAAAIKRSHKRIDYLISEFERFRLNNPELTVWLVIAGGWEAETDALIEEGHRRLGDRVRFLVRFPRSRMPELYRAADLFVLCSLFEMMPIALIEAAASGLPCIVNDHPILTWMTGPGGLAIDMATQGRLASCLSETATNPERRQEIGRAARQYCEANFSQNQVLRMILSYYNQIKPGVSSGVLNGDLHQRRNPVVQ